LALKTQNIFLGSDEQLWGPILAQDDFSLMLCQAKMGEIYNQGNRCLGTFYR
jgi:hypothetical protein